MITASAMKELTTFLKRKDEFKQNFVNLIADWLDRVFSKGSLRLWPWLWLWKQNQVQIHENKNRTIWSRNDSKPTKEKAIVSAWGDSSPPLWKAPTSWLSLPSFLNLCFSSPFYSTPLKMFQAVPHPHAYNPPPALIQHTNLPYT